MRADQTDAPLKTIERRDRAACLDQWRDMFGRPAPKHISLHFMRRILIWEAQNRAHGRLSRKVERRLKDIASGKTSAVTAPGARLVREWNGRTYQVEVAQGG